jgi:hypothetical protein
MGAVALRATLTTPRAACAAAAQLPPCEDDSGRILAGPDPSQSAAHLDVPALDRPVVVCVGGSTHRIDRACQRAEALFRAPYACATRKAAAATGPTTSASIPWVRQRGRSLAGLSHVVRSERVRRRRARARFFTSPGVNRPAYLLRRIADTPVTNPCAAMPTWPRPAFGLAYGPITSENPSWREAHRSAAYGAAGGVHVRESAFSDVPDARSCSLPRGDSETTVAVASRLSPRTGVCDCRPSLPLSDPFQGEEAAVVKGRGLVTDGARRPVRR